MYTSIVLVGFLGFFCLYNTSQKAKLSKSGKIEIWLQANVEKAKFIGITLLLLSFVALIAKEGWTVGLFNSILLLMTAGSLIVLLAPFKYLHFTPLVLVVLLFMIIEILVF